MVKFGHMKWISFKNKITLVAKRNPIERLRKTAFQINAANGSPSASVFWLVLPDWNNPAGLHHERKFIGLLAQ